MNELQRTEQWFSDRLGYVTASRLKDVLAKGEGKTRKSYMYQLLAEIKTGQQMSTFSSKAMQDGTEKEPLAKMAYEIKTGNFITECGSIKHPTIQRFSASPDGLIGDNAVIEIKCPLPSTYLEYRNTGIIDRAYQLQMTGQLMCTGRELAYFVMYCPEMINVDEQMIIAEFKPDSKMIDDVGSEVIKFVEELEEMI